MNLANQLRREKLDLHLWKPQESQMISQINLNLYNKFNLQTHENLNSKLALQLYLGLELFLEENQNE
jgi:hypothetical protein